MHHLTPDALLKLVQASKEPLTKRDIARAFGIKGGDRRVALKQILKTLEKDGALIKHAGGAYSVPQGLPAVTVVEVLEITVDGEIHAAPTDWNPETQGPAPKIEIMPDKKHFPVMKEHSRALVRLSRIDDTLYEAHIIKPLDTEKGRVMGIIRLQKKGAVLVPTGKKAKYDFDIPQADLNGGRDGDLAVAEIQPARGALGKQVRIVEIVGTQDNPKAISLISLYESGLQEHFSDKVLSETRGLKVPELGDREDLRTIPLVTIDGIDARDFDDAVFAEKTKDGFHLIVAIADVAHYVKTSTALDTEAQKRGNSTYFPDRVVPMLPEALSNDLCSLRPHEPRACLAVHMKIDQRGALKSYKFVRGLMQSQARLTYEQVQYWHDCGFSLRPSSPHPNPLPKGARGLFEKNLVPSPLWGEGWGEGQTLGPIIKPLYEAFAVLNEARIRRGALDLDLPERQILMDAEGNMTGVKKRERLDAHRLIEEFMILANVCAASALEDKRDPKHFPCVYRIHDKPSFDKLESVREFIEGFGLSLPRGQVTAPAQINGVLKQAALLPYSHLISQVILRSQSQAVYSTQNIGHFGLALERYAHFTSPIRRYADLMVHRALIKAYGLGDGGIDEGEIARLDEICQNISQTERTSMEAERSAVDRFTARYLSEKIGAEFEGKISGVTRFGLFVTLNDSGADGLIPMRAMGDDFYEHVEKAHALIGRKKGKIFRLGAAVTVRLKEADGMTGSTLLELAGASVNGADIPGLTIKTPQKNKSGYYADKQPAKDGPKKFHKHGKKPHRSKRKS